MVHFRKTRTIQNQSSRWQEAIQIKAIVNEIKLNKTMQAINEKKGLVFFVVCFLEK